VVQATSVAAVTLPCVLLAHLLTTGTVVSAPAAALCGLVVLLVGGAVPARSTGRLALCVGSAQVAAHAVLALLPAQAVGTPRGCLPAVGRGAELGLRLAVLRPDSGCPTGTLAAGTTITAAVAAMLTAVVIVAGHAAAAALSGALLAGARTVLAVVVALVALVALVLTARPVTPGWPRVLRAGPATRRPVRAQRRPGPVLRRGPPGTVHAAA
jgi:hypothetical protein